MDGKENIKLRELKEMVDVALDGTPDYYNPDVGVVISTGGFPSTPQVLVKSVSMGFDWDTNFMIRTSVPLIPKKDTPLRNQIETLEKEIEVLTEKLNNEIIKHLD